MSQRSHLISCKCKPLHRLWWNQKLFDYFIRWRFQLRDTHFIQLKFIYLSSIPRISKTLGCILYTPLIHTSVKQCILPSYYHISWKKYVAITRIIHIDYKHCYGRSNLVVVNSLNFVVNNFSTSQASSKIFHPSPSIL